MEKVAGPSMLGSFLRDHDWHVMNILVDIWRLIGKVLEFRVDIGRDWQIQEDSLEFWKLDAAYAAY